MLGIREEQMSGQLVLGHSSTKGTLVSVLIIGCGINIQGCFNTTAFIG